MSMLLNTQRLNRRMFLELAGIGLLGLSLGSLRSSAIQAGQQGRLSWSKAAELPGGHVTDLVVSPSDPEVLYLSSNVNAMGIWKSTDSGISWRRVLYDELEPGTTHPRALALHPRDPDTLFVSDLHGRIMMTTDGGRSWSIQHEEIPPDNPEASPMNALVIASADPNWLYAGTQGNKLLRNTDVGRRWQVVGRVGRGGIGALAVHPRDPRTLYIGTEDGLYRSNDAGARASRLSPIRSPVIALAISPSAPELIFAGGAEGLARSTDGGTQWEILLRGVDVHSVTLAPSDSAIIYLGTREGIYLSRDGGENWTQVNNGLLYLDIGPVAVHPRDPQVAWTGTNIWQWTPPHIHEPMFPADMKGEGIYKTTDGGGHWLKSDQGFIDVDVNSIALDPTDPQVVYVGTECSRGIYRSFDVGDSWSLIAGGPPRTPGDLAHYTMVIETDSEGAIYLTGRFGAMKSENRGQNWRSLTPRRHYHGLAVAPTNPKLVFLGTGVGGPEQPYPGAHIFKSIDGGRTWREKDEGFPHGVDASVHAFAIDPSDAEIVYVATASHEEGLPRSSTTLGVYKTTDGGERWVEVNSGLFSHEVLALVIDPAQPQVLYAGTEEGVFKTADAARRWRTTGLIGMLVHALAIDPANPQVLYAGTERGLFFSEDDGTRWQRVTAVPAQVVKGIAIAPTGGIAYAAVNNVGVFKGVR